MPNLPECKPVKPDTDKILYSLQLLKEGKTALIEPEELLGMFYYILDNNLLDKEQINICRLSIIVNTCYGIDTQKIIRERGFRTC